MIRPPPRSTLFPYTTLSRSARHMRGMPGLRAACWGRAGTWMKPPRAPGAALPWASQCMSAKNTWLQTKVPAVLDTEDGMPRARRLCTTALMGSVEKYAAGAPGITTWSTGWRAAWSGMRASSILMATRSGVNSLRPPARPRLMTSTGCNCASASCSWRSDSPNTQRSCRPWTMAPATVSPCRARATSHEGLTGSCSNGSKPVTRMRGEVESVMATVRPLTEHQEVQQEDIGGQQGQGRGHLGSDHGILVDLQQRGGHQVEVGRHGRQQGAAVAREHADGRHHGRVAMVDADQDRHAHAARHHREGREAIAHHHREQRHAQHVDGHGHEADVHVDIRSEERRVGKECRSR